VEYLRNRGYIVYELVRSSEKAKDSKYYQFFDLAQPQKIPSLKGVDVLFGRFSTINVYAFIEAT